MRKLLLGTAAIALGMSFATSQANAQVKLDVGGYAKMYGNWLNQDEAGNVPDALATTAGADESTNVRSLDFARDTEIHLSGETTLDNGLTVGFHTEAMADVSGPANATNDSFDVQESYAYFSGAWGRVNLGAEDGATYLMQVAAPSADSNVDGIRQWINPVNHASLSNAAADYAAPTDSVMLQDIYGGIVVATDDIIHDTGAAGATAGDTRVGAASNGSTLALGHRFDYDQATSGYENKLTYMTPVFNGFQAGVSYTPELGSNAGNGVNNNVASGNNLSNQTGDYGSVWELAARYEGQFDEVGVTLGGGYSHASLEKNVTNNATGCAAAVFYQDATANGCTADDKKWSLTSNEAWNVGVDMNWKAFGLGAAYLNDDNGVSGNGLENQTWVVGLDYTTGPFKLGGTYYNQDQKIADAKVKTDRWTGGVVYTYGPGMTFRGSVSYAKFDENVGEFTAGSTASSNANATSLILGTQINF